MGDNDKREGQWQEAKGKAKQAWGDLTDNERMQAEGEATERKGEAKQAWASTKDAAEETVARDDDDPA